jgi:hypothetical protein
MPTHLEEVRSRVTLFQVVADYILKLVDFISHGNTQVRQLGE